MKTFTYKGREYIRVIPSKFMMASTMLYEMITRGDILAMAIDDQKLVCIKGTELVEHHECNILKVVEDPS